MADLIVKWDKMGDEFTYDVWYATEQDGPWIKHNSIRLYDDILSVSGIYDSTNVYTLDGLGSDQTYYVRVTCQDKYASWWVGYTSATSTGGGYAHDEDAPDPPYYNTIGFKINVT